MTPYYKECLDKGLEFQDFVMTKLMEKLGIAISCYNSSKYQYAIGENKQGVEIKFDDRYKETGNLYIEIAEKSNPDNPCFVSSGIYRNDNSWLYLIGDYDIIFIFSKILLRNLHKSKKYREVKIPTSKGFLIDKEQAEKYAAKIIKLNE